MKRVLIGAIVISAFVLLSVLPDGTTLGQDSKTPNTTQALMHQKLESAHAILEGLVREDHKLIAMHAERLKNISKVTTWHKPDNEQFLGYARSFQNATDYLLEQSRANNLEGIAMGQVRLNLECVQCHNFVRAGRAKK